MYEAPLFSNVENKAVRGIIGAWQVSGTLLARTGVPVQLSQMGMSLQVTRPDYIGGPVYLDDYQKTLRYLEASSSRLLPLNSVSRAPERPGNVGNNAIREPGAWNVNLGISKEFFFTEQSRFRIGVEAFNAFNHTNLTGLVTNLNNRFFGELQGTAGARQVQLNGRLSW